MGARGGNPAADPQKAAPVGASAGVGGDRHPDPRSLQSRVAAETLRLTATKYPWWYESGVRMPFSKHPAYDPCRKLLDSAWGLAHQIAYKFDDPSGLEWLASALPNAWMGDLGVYNLVRFVDTYLPPRPTITASSEPDVVHGLYGIRLFNRIQLQWAYKAPGRKRRYADPTTYAIHLNTSWDKGRFPPCCYPGEPRPHVWSEPGFLMPEGSPFSYVRRLPWWCS